LKTAASVASSVLEQAWGSRTAQAIIVLIVVAAIGSVFAERGFRPRDYAGVNSTV